MKCAPVHTMILICHVTHFVVCKILKYSKISRKCAYSNVPPQFASLMPQICLLNVPQDLTQMCLLNVPPQCRSSVIVHGCWPPVCITAVSHCLELPYWHYQLVLSWYLHQPESHQLSLQKVLDGLTDIWTQRSDPRFTWVR